MRTVIIISLMASLLAACDSKNNLQRISSSGKAAESVYLTHDQHDNPVVVWTEREDKDLSLWFAVSQDDGKSFTEKVPVPINGHVATHPEGMPKVAFKKDGTILAAYESKTPTQENKYAGAIYYVLSRDGGKSWTPPRFVHSDTTAGRSRSYFDIETLPDGEIGAAWLDVTIDDETGGRSVKFAKTNGDGFAHETLVDSSACQCCRVDVYSDITGKINVAYRGLAKGLMGQDVRDMMIATSADNGERFTRPLPISNDNWAIDGCPHTGPSLCCTKDGLFSVWYTEGNGTGIYYSFRQDNESDFGDRQLISNFGHHPQVSAGGVRFVMVWEENSAKGENTLTNVRYELSDGSNVRKGLLTPSDQNAFVPVVTQAGNGFVVAFLMETNNGVGVYTTRLY
jgi:hypothetical protein